MSRADIMGGLALLTSVAALFYLWGLIIFSLMPV